MPVRIEAIGLSCALALASCSGSEPTEESPGSKAEQSSSLSQPVVEECGQVGSQDVVALSVIQARIPRIGELALESQQEVAGALNVVPAPCCPCWEQGSIAQCYLLAPAGCENLEDLVDRAVRLAASGVRGNELQGSLQYGDYWQDIEAITSSWPEPVPAVRIEVWMDPSGPLSSGVWQQFSSLRVESGTDSRLGFRVRYFVPSSAETGWAAAALAAREQGLEFEFIQSILDAASEVRQDAGLKEIALAQAVEETRQFGLDAVLWEEARGSTEIQERLHMQQQQAIELGVRSAPTWFVNGYRLRGFQSQSSVQRVISMGLLDTDSMPPTVEGH